MKKYINFRYFFVLTLSLILVIYFCLNVLNTLFAKIIFIGIFIIISLILFFFWRKCKNKTILIIISLCIISIFVVGNLSFKQNYYNNYKKFNDCDVVIKAKISSNYTETSSGNIKFVVDKISIYSSQEYYKLNSKLDFYLSTNNLDLYEIKAGNIFEAKTKINFYDENTFSNKNKLSNNVVGYAFCESSDLKIVKIGKSNIKEIVQKFVYDKFCKWDITNSGLAIAMIFGNTAYLGDDINSIFRDIGIVHIVAVSGMNISILLFLVSFILKKLKINKLINFIINFILLFIYSYLCGFVVSVLRAALMALISNIATIRGKPYDRLSCLSFIASLFLIINPLMLYNYSFILSFSTVLTIILIYNNFKRLLDKIFYKNFSESLSLTLSVQSWLLFVQLYLFYTFPTISVVSNIFLVPIIVFAFELLLIFTPIVLILPFMSFLMKIYDFLINISLKLANWLNNFNLVLTVTNLSIFSLFLSFLILFFISDYYFVSRKNKTILFFSSSFLIIVIQLLSNII